MKISHLDHASAGSNDGAAEYEVLPLLLSAVTAFVGITLAVFLCAKKKMKEEEDTIKVKYYDVDPESAVLPKEVIDEINDMAIQKKKFDEQYKYCKAHGGKLPDDLMEIVKEEVVEAIGSKVAITEALRLNIAILRRNLKRRASGSLYDESHTALVLAPLEQEYKWAKPDLERATGLVIDSWEVPPPPDLSADPVYQHLEEPKSKDPLAGHVREATPPPGSQYLEVLDKMPIARRPGEDTLVSFIGADYLRAGGEETPELPTLVEHFREARKDDAEKLTLKILSDFDAYDVAYKYQVSTAGQATLDKLVAASKSFTLPSESKYNAMVKDKNAPDPKSLSFAIYAQKMGVLTSVALYKIVGAIVAVAAIVDTHIQAGGIKPFRRIISKTLTKYTNFGKCTDIARITVACKTLAEVATLLEKFLGCKQLQILRIKNRFDSKLSPFTLGGYRDVQLTVLIQVGKSKVWRFAEIQINLVEIVFIKDGAATGAGYEALDLARAIGSFNSRTLRHVGKATEAQWHSFSVGAMLELDHSGVSLKGAAAAAPLMRSLNDDRIRVQVLKLRECQIDQGTGIALGKILETNHTILYLDLEGNKFGPEGGKAICEALEYNSSMTHINLRTNELGELAGAALGESLRVNHTLTHLNLEETKLSTVAGKAITEALITNKSVREIALAFNQIGERGAENIVKAINENPLLKKIDLRFNVFSFEVKEEMIKATKKSKSKCEVILQAGYGEKAQVGWKGSY